MPRLEFAQKAVVVDDDRVLMLRKASNDPYHPGRWDLPGGRMKGSEEDIDAHLIREVLEETGLKVHPFGRPIHLWSWVMDWNGESVRVLAVSRYCQLEPSDPVHPQREDDDFLCEQRWIPRAELLSFDIIPSQIATIRRVVHEEQYAPT